MLDNFARFLVLFSGLHSGLASLEIGWERVLAGRRRPVWLVIELFRLGAIAETAGARSVGEVLRSYILYHI